MFLFDTSRKHQKTKFFCCFRGGGGGGGGVCEGTLAPNRGMVVEADQISENFRRDNYLAQDLLAQS